MRWGDVRLPVMTTLVGGAVAAGVAEAYLLTIKGGLTGARRSGRGKKF